MTEKNASPARQWWYLGFIVAPILLFIALFGWGVIQELQAKQQVQLMVTQMSRRGVAIGNEAASDRLDQKTDRSRAARWQKVLDAASALQETYAVPIVSEKWEVMERTVPPDEDWMLAPVLQQYSEHAQPVIAELRALLAEEKPIWQPIVFEDFETLLPGLQSTRDLSRMLSYEFRAAYHAGDHQRAIETLAMIPRVPEAVDNSNYMVVELVRVAIIGVHRSLIRDSLRHDYWTLEEIEQLNRQLGPIADTNERWRRSIDTELSSVYGLIVPEGDRIRKLQGIHGSNPLLSFMVAPTHQLAMIRYSDALSTLPINFELRHDDAADEKSNQWEPLRSANSLIAVPFANVEPFVGLILPAYEAYEAAFTRMHRERRWTRCALAVKEFQLRFERWPEALDELSQVGLAQHDWLADKDMPFGYRVADDGSHVLLWTSWIDDFQKVSPEPPSTIEKYQKQDLLDVLEVRIE